MIRVVNSAEPVVSSRSLSSGNSGVRSSKRGRFRASSGASPDTESMRMRAGNFSFDAAGRQAPSTKSPRRMANRRAWLIEM